MNVANLLRLSALCFPDRPALSWGRTRLSYGEFDRRSAAFADWLVTEGGAPGGRVVLFLDNRPELLVTLFGTFRAGSTIVPCNSRLTAEELGFIVEDCGVAVVVTDPAHETVARSAAAATGARVIVAGHELDAVLATPPATLEPAEVDPDDTAWIFYTSGTTGRPKGAMLSHAVLNFCTISWLADLTPLDEHDVTLHAAPLSHGAGFHALAATARAAHQVIPDAVSFDPAGILELIRARGVTNTWLVPTQIVMLTDAADHLPVPTLQHVVYGGAPMTPAAMTRALERFGPVFVQLYGQGETPMTATFLRRQDHLPELLGSAGRPRPGIEIRIVDDAGQSLPPGEVGELVVRGPSVMSGYWNRPEATAETVVDGWLHTGDLGRMTADGIVFLLDRSKDMIISGGSNVYAVEVEQVLSQHPAVGEVAVVGVPDDLWGELVVAVVVPAPGEPVDTEALGRFCREHLAGYKLPRRFVVQDALPRNAYGKVLKRELRQTVA